MVRVDMQVAVGNDVEIDQAMPRDLVEHVVEKGNAGGELALATAIEIDADGDLRLQGITGNFGLPHLESKVRSQASRESATKGHDTISFRIPPNESP